MGASFEMVADRVQFLGSNGNGATANGANGHANGAAEPAYAEDDVPF
ncbi:MAG: hypothetical protein IPM39_28485 [Chloroflexi bacterium]|nr:hypothetical protein [Chloroflexota bacterium]